MLERARLLCTMLCLSLCSAPLVGCIGGEDSNESNESNGGPSYHEGISDILEARCVNCHSDGQVAPFSLDSYDEAKSYQGIIAQSVEQGSMPPWMPDNSCNQYQRDLSLSDAERDSLLAWVAAGAPEGTPTGEASPPTPEDDDLSFDLTLPMAEPYTPQARPDDYRCFVMDWSLDETRYVTAFKASPGHAEMVHHVISFIINPNAADEFRAMDEAEDGPGYTCFGSPVAGEASFGASNAWRWLGSWTPGGSAREMPAGTGIAVEPGSVMVMQVHYNTLDAEPEADITSFEVKLADAVDRPAVVMPLTNYRWVMGSTPMSIPAGSTDSTHTFTTDLSDTVLNYLGSPAGLSPGDSFQIHSIGIHMHLLGTTGRIWLDRSGGEEECLLDIPRWDFNWQGTYEFAEPITVHSGDLFNLRCQWDNSATNQIVVDGEQLPPQDVAWGDGTRDEMCLAIAYATAL